MQLPGHKTVPKRAHLGVGGHIWGVKRARGWKMQLPGHIMVPKRAKGCKWTQKKRLAVAFFYFNGESGSFFM